MLDSKNILQIDATVIAGILVLLSLIFIGGERIPQESEEPDPLLGALSLLSKTPVAWIYLLGVIFSLSAFSALIMSLKEDTNSLLFFYGRLFSIGFLALGFIFTAIGFYSLGIELLFSRT